MQTPTGKVLVGRDVTMYYVIPGGLDNLGNTFTAGNQVSFVGIWTDIEINAKNNWAEVTSSSAKEEERRRTTWEWTATLSNRIRGRTVSLDAFVDNDYFQVVFQEASTGYTWQLTGGIDSAAMARSKEAGKDTIELTSIGEFNGQPSLKRLS